MLTNFTRFTGTCILAILFMGVRAQNSIRPYTLVYSENIKGGSAMVGNTSLHIVDNNQVNLVKMNENSNPNNGLGGIGFTQYGNDNQNMQFARIDNSTPGIYNATSSDLVLPAGTNTIRFARLYWGGRILTSAITQTADTLRKVKIRKGNSGNYFDILAPAPNVDFFNVTTTERIYQAYVDVTAFIQNNGAGTYTVANIPATPGSIGGGGRFTGWSLVVAYENPTMPYNSVRVYDGYSQIFNTGAGPVTQTVTLSGLNVPNNTLAADEAVLQVMAWEGDGNLGSSTSNPLGDYIRINNITVSNASNQATNFWNGTITKNGTYVSTKNPNYSNQMGIDIDEVNVGVGYNILPNASTVLVQFGTEADQYFPSAFTFSIRMKDPLINLNKTVNDSSANGYAEPNELLTYTLSGSNPGPGAAYNAYIIDSLPRNVTYVPGSLEVVSGPGLTAGFLTDLADADQGIKGIGPNNRHYIKVFIGEGSNGNTGGVIPAGVNGFFTIRFKVRASAIPGTIINTARVVSTSQVGDPFTDDGTAVIGETGGPVPVKLTVFQVRKQGNQALLNWTTDFEINSDRFEVERSTNGIDFSVRGTVSAGGDVMVPSHYRFTDALQSSSPVYYYRLRMIDKDGTYAYSRIQAIKMNAASADETISIFPNPYVQHVKISVTLPEDGHVQLRVFSAEGKLMIQKSQSMLKGNSIWILPEMGMIPAGTYMLELKTDAGIFTRSIIKN